MRVVLLLVLSIGVVVQAQAPQQKPCTEEELSRVMAEARADTAETMAALKELRLGHLEGENARLRVALNSAGQKLASEQSNVATLTTANETAKGKISDLGNELKSEQETVASLRSQRDKLAAQIKAANGRWICEAMSIGCIKEK